MRRIVACSSLVLGFGCATARPEKMSWAEAMRHFAPMREQYRRNFDSPEKRLREKK